MKLNKILLLILIVVIAGCTQSMQEPEVPAEPAEPVVEPAEPLPPEPEVESVSEEPELAEPVSEPVEPEGFPYTNCDEMDEYELGKCGANRFCQSRWNNNVYLCRSLGLENCIDEGVKMFTKCLKENIEEFCLDEAREHVDTCIRNSQKFKPYTQR